MSVFLSIVNGLVVGLSLTTVLGFIEAWNKKVHLTIIIVLIALIAFVAIADPSSTPVFEESTDWWYFGAMVVGGLPGSGLGRSLYEDWRK